MVSEIRMTLQTATIVKVLLAEPLKPRYGLEIAKDAGLASGTLYPALARLEEAGWITSAWEDIDEAAEGRRRRRYYKLTGEGIPAARKALERTAEKISLSPLPTPGPTLGGARA